MNILENMFNSGRNLSAPLHKSDKVYGCCYGDVAEEERTEEHRGGSSQSGTAVRPTVFFQFPQTKNRLSNCKSGSCVAPGSRSIKLKMDS